MAQLQQLHSVTKAVKLGSGTYAIERMKRYVFPHPTCGEAIREALFAAKL